jgi:hypothetical protein
VNEQEKAWLLEQLVACRIEGLTLGRKLRALQDANAALQLTVCLAKLEAFDAAIVMEVDELRYGEKEQQP